MGSGKNSPPEDSAELAHEQAGTTTNGTSINPSGTWNLNGQIGNAASGAGGKKNSPAPPDYAGAAEKDTQTNRPDINTPFSSESWTQGPDGKWHLKTGLSDEVKNAYANAPKVDYDALPKAETGQEAADATYNQMESRLNPEWAQKDEQLNAHLANQGIDPNSEAGRNAAQTEANQRGDAYAGARNEAWQQGRLAANDSVLRRQQALSEALGKHELPLQDLSGERGFMGMPGFNTGGNNLQALSQLYGAQLGQYNNKNQQEGDLLGTVGSLASLLALIA